MSCQGCQAHIVVISSMGRDLRVLEEENSVLRAEIERLRELAGNLECAYCGEIVGKVQGDGSDELMLRNHVEGCEQHPLTEARSEIKRLRESSGIEIHREEIIRLSGEVQSLRSRLDAAVELDQLERNLLVGMVMDYKETWPFCSPTRGELIAKLRGES